MRFGLNVGYSGAACRIDMPLIKEADRLGFHSVWTAEAYGSDAVDAAGLDRRRRPSASTSAPASCRCRRARRR